MVTHAVRLGTNAAIRGNRNYVQQSQSYGAKAIEIIEADKKLEGMTDEQWNTYKTKSLPELYQSQGILLYISGNKPEARVKLEKAAALKIEDPNTYMLLADLVNDDYKQLAEQHKTLMAGPVKDETLKQAHAKMDELMEVYAHLIALTEGKPQFQQIHDQTRQLLESYYKYRKGSTDGMQQLIDKYKKAPAQ
jgi:hypothetical protein